MTCQACRVEAPTKYVEFYQNIGMLVMRRSRSIKGDLCKTCINKYFWQFTGTNLVLGWWGMISLVLNTIFIINNVGRYLTCLTMPPVPPDAQRAAAPTRTLALTDDVIRKLNPCAPEIFRRLQAKEPIDFVAQSVANQIGVTPDQVVLFVRVVSEKARQAQQARQQPMGPRPL